MVQQTKHFYEFGPFRLDTTERLLLRGGEAVALTPKLFDILLVLVSNSGHILEKEEVIRAVWPDTVVEEGSLTRNISTLRKALGENPAEPQYIETIPWRGYRFVAPVRASADVSAELVIEEHLRTRIIAEETETDGATETVIAVAEAPHAGSSALTVVRNWLRLHSVLAIGLVVSLGAVAIIGLTLRRQPASRRGAAGFSAFNVTLQKLTNTGNVLGASLSPDGQFVVYTTLDEENRGALWLRRVGSKEAMQLVPPTPDGIWSFTVSHDNSWIFYVQSDRDEPTRSGTIFRLPILGGTPRKLTEKVDSDVTLSPDDQRMAFDRFRAGGDSDLVTANATDGSDERVIATAKANSPKEFLHPQWSPDGTKILFFNIEERADGKYWSLAEMSAGGGTSKLVLQPRRQRIWFMAWADDGDGIVLNASDPVTNLPQLYYVSYPAGETQRVSNDVFYYNGVSVGGDSVVTTRLDRPTNIWVTAGPDVRQARQLTSGGVFLDSLTWTPDGRIVYDAWDDGKRHLWMMDSDGQHRQQLSPESVEDRMPDVSPDGKHLVFLSNRSGAWALWLMDIDGRNPRRLTMGVKGVSLPRFAPDGQSVFFEMEQGTKTILARIPIDGGEAMGVVSDVRVDLYDISPDGRQVAYSFLDDQLKPVRVVIRPVEGDGPVTYFDFAPRRFLLWTLDGKGLAYEQAEADHNMGSVIWVQPLAGGPPKQIGNFYPDTIYSAEWSHDGSQLAFVRGRLSSDLVLLTRSKTQP